MTFGSPCMIASWRESRTRCRARRVGRDYSEDANALATPRIRPHAATGNAASHSQAASSSSAEASDAQQPQADAQPVRAVSSANSRQPASAARRMSRSVTPLHTHTYMTGSRAARTPHSNANANGCQYRTIDGSPAHPRVRPCRCPVRAADSGCWPPPPRCWPPAPDGAMRASRPRV